MIKNETDTVDIAVAAEVAQAKPKRGRKSSVEQVAESASAQSQDESSEQNEKPKSDDKGDGAEVQSNQPQNSTVKTPPKKLDPSTLIPVRCMLQNRMGASNHVLRYCNQNTGADFKWHKFGDVCYISLQELLLMKSQQPRFFDDGWVSISNYLDFNSAQEVISQLGLTESLGYMQDKDFDELFAILKLEDVEKFKIELRKIPQSIVPTLLARAQEMIKRSEITNLQIVIALKDMYPDFAF